MIKSTGRKKHLDILKTIAIFMVVFNHSSAYKLFFTTPKSKFWFLYFISASISKTAVPLFFMISGALLIPKEEDLYQVYSKRLPKFIIILFISSFLMYIHLLSKTGGNVNIKVFFSNIIKGPIIVPYWYLYAYLGFLLSLPFLKKLSEGMTVEYYSVFFCMNIIYSVISKILIVLWDIQISHEFRPILFTTNIFVYPLAGFYIEKAVQDNSIKIKEALKKGGIIFIFWIIVSSVLVQFDIRRSGDLSFSERAMSFSLLIPSMFIYLLVYCYSNLASESNKIVELISRNTLYIYLLESIARDKTMFIYTHLKAIIGVYASSLIHMIIIVSIGATIGFLLDNIFKFLKTFINDFSSGLSTL